VCVCSCVCVSVLCVCVSVCVGTASYTFKDSRRANHTFRVTKTHRLPYLCRSHSANKPYNSWKFCVAKYAAVYMSQNKS